METVTYKFSEFTRAKVEEEFGLDVLKDTVLMNTWLAKAQLATISDFEKMSIHRIREKLNDLVGSWNEAELQMQFIAPLLTLIDFSDFALKIGAFSERTLKKQFKHVVIQGNVDWMAASGRYVPKQPFFFIHEYKRGIDGSGEPVGQLLITMYVAQALNNEPPKPTLFNQTPKIYKDIPLYGCYVIGRHWYFVVLKDKDYYLSTPYDAGDEEELYEIVKLLKAQKQLIIERVTANQKK